MPKRRAWSAGRKPRTGIPKAEGSVSKTTQNFTCSTMVKTLVLQETKNKVNSGTLKFHLGAVYQTKRGQDRKTRNLKDDLHQNYDLSVLRVNKAKGGEEDKV